MAWGVGSILNMGVGALFNSQANIQTTGNNISNVNTVGYSRQAVRQEEATSLTSRAGQVGQGVNTTEVIRYFDAFLESNYLDKVGTSQRFESQYSQLRYVENIFNESNVNGLSNSLTELWKAWNKLAQQPDSLPTREALLGTAGTLASTIRNTDASLAKQEEQLNAMIEQDVTTANQLLKEIADLNKEINLSYQAGRNNPNALMDKRDQKVRELAAIIDVKVEDRGPGHYNVSMQNGYTLVQDTIPFSLEIRNGNIDYNLGPNSPFKPYLKDPADPDSMVHPAIKFEGSDYREYLVQVDSPGAVDGDPTATPPVAAATFKVSVDGGKTWLTNPNTGGDTWDALSTPQKIGNLEISFSKGEVLPLSKEGPGSLAEGDKFVISPKKDVFWVSPTSDSINISPQIYGNGQDNKLRMTGGSLAGILEFRDYQLGEYRTRLDAFAKELIWQVNQIHSNGAGLETLTGATGTYMVGDPKKALGSAESLFTWADKLQQGSLTFEVYDKDGKSVIPYPGLDVFKNFGKYDDNGDIILGTETDVFDPSIHSLHDVACAITESTYVDKDGNPVKPFAASVTSDGRLEITAKEGHSFAVTTDSSGLMAALGINTFFSGDDAGSMGLNDVLSNNLNLINAGRVNGAGEVNSGDNKTAFDLADLANKKVSIGTLWNKPTDQTLNDNYASLVTKVGADTQSVKFTAANETAMALDLYERSEEISGVSLDEEMSALIKFQASYKAAAKLITTADEMMQTLLSLKQ
ncbi:flagellar hook-associated protein FlgK [Desulfovibrio sp. OttesenSCG-928-G15]|nr:flagellar hook-associated protein FlgK [Desulfovibrio sp. OttesenSCG-928-G15]